MHAPVTRGTPLFARAIKVLIVVLALFGQITSAVATPAGTAAQAQIAAVNAAAIFCQAGVQHPAHHTPPPAPSTASMQCPLPAMGGAAAVMLASAPVLPRPALAFASAPPPARGPPNPPAIITGASLPRGPPVRV